MILLLFCSQLSISRHWKRFRRAICKIGHVFFILIHTKTFKRYDSTKNRIISFNWFLVELIWIIIKILIYFDIYYVTYIKNRLQELCNRYYLFRKVMWPLNRDLQKISVVAWQIRYHRLYLYFDIGQKFVVRRWRWGWWLRGINFLLVVRDQYLMSREYYAAELREWAVGLGPPRGTA